MEHLAIKQKKNIIYNQLIFIFAILVIFSPTILFLFIIFLNPNFSIYIKNYEYISSEFPGWPSPNYLWIIASSFIGLVLLIVAIIIVCFLNKMYNTRKTSNYGMVIMNFSYLLIFLLAAISFAIAEYCYSKFNLLFGFLSKINFSFISDNIKSIQQEIHTNTNNEVVYNWTGGTITWWVLFVRVEVIVLGYILIQNLTQINLDKHHGQSINNEVKKDNVGNNVIAKLYNKLFVSSEKCISIWLIITTTLILLPQFVFVIRLSTNGDRIKSILEWTFIVPSLTKNMPIMNEYNSTIQVQSINSFVVTELPIIFVAFSFATCLIFFAIFIKGWKYNKRIFLTQFILQIIEVVFTTIITTIAMWSLNNLVEQWNNSNTIDAIVKIKDDKVAGVLISLFGDPSKTLTHKVTYMWLYGIEYISEVVITLAFISTIYPILGYKILKMNKKEVKIKP